MTTQYIQGTTTINRDVVFRSLYNEVEDPYISKLFQQNVKTLSGFSDTIGTIVESVNFFLIESEASKSPEFFAQDTSASLKLGFEEEIESGVTQEFADIQQQLPPFPVYNEEDILNLDADIITPRCEFSTIRVKLIYEEPSKPIPVEDPWE